MTFVAQSIFSRFRSPPIQITDLKFLLTIIFMNKKTQRLQVLKVSVRWSIDRLLNLVADLELFYMQQLHNLFARELPAKQIFYYRLKHTTMAIFPVFPEHLELYLLMDLTKIQSHILHLGY